MDFLEFMVLREQEVAMEVKEKELTWEEYQALLGKVPEGYRLVMMGNKYFLKMKNETPLWKEKPKKKKK